VGSEHLPESKPNHLFPINSACFNEVCEFLRGCTWVRFRIILFVIVSYDETMPVFGGLGLTPCSKVGLMAITVHAIYAATNLMHECACHTTSLRTTSLACIRRQLTCAFNVPYVQRFPASNAVPRSELLHRNFVHLFSVRVAGRCLLFNGSFHGHLYQTSTLHFHEPSSFPCIHRATKLLTTPPRSPGP
jgi:hypothetical protein